MYNDSSRFSLWCDFIERDFIDNGFSKLIKDAKISGATSNPAIFKSAFLNSKAYAKTIESSDKRHPKALYEILATQDIKMAACKLLSLYANGNDGFISIEIDPNLSFDAGASIAEGIKLYTSIAMPNVMIKVPATAQGFEVMSVLMANGISVNATLVFSPEQAKGCLEAFSEGTKIYKKRYPNTTLPQGVISVFVSRFDRLLDEVMVKNSLPKTQVGIMNAAKIYHIIQNKGLENVRTLFASTGVKGNELRADYYISELMYENTINTAPIESINEFIKHNSSIKNAPQEQSIESFFEVIKSANIDINSVYKELLNDGLKAFVVAFDEIMGGLRVS